MKGIIINPNSFNSVIASTNIAKFLSNKMKIPMYGKHNFKEIKKNITFEWVLLMNSGFGCVTDKEFGEWIADTVKKSAKPVFICNDYKLLYPCGYTRFIDPKKYTYWTTIPEYDGRLCKELIYVNWNKLTYQPSPVIPPKYTKVIYWGAYRKSRISKFEKFLNHKLVTISTSSRAKKGFIESCPNATLIPNFEHLYQSIKKYWYTIYLEDDTKKYCSPANRFYEAISAGVPMFFQPESVNTFKKAGYDVSKYVIHDTNEFSKKILLNGFRYQMQIEQLAWRRDYIKELNQEVDNAIARTK